MKCQHENFECDVGVNRLQEGKDGPVTRYQADVRIQCCQCGMPFRFIGLPSGVDLNGAAVSVDGTEARLAISPRHEVLTPVDPDACSGFTVRRSV